MIAKTIALVKVNVISLSKNEKEILAKYIKEQLEDYAVLVVFDDSLEELIKVELIK
jgi:hypothetical protein